MITPDLTEARRLLDAGFNLVLLHNNRKRPVGDKWNTPSSYVTTIKDDATGYGMPLVANDLCSIDPDHYEMAKAGMAAWGFDLDALLAAGVRTVSTRPNSGGRSAFAADPMEMCSWLTFTVFDENNRGTTVLELRAKSPNLQDCVPGLVYLDQKGNGPFTQEYANGKTFDDRPDLPDEFARFWRAMSSNHDEYVEQTEKFVEGIRAAGFDATGKKRQKGSSVPRCLKPLTSTGKLAYPAPCRNDFNKAHSVEDILAAHGYSQHGNRWAHPSATGGPGIRLIPHKDDLWYSDHGGDPLRGCFDAWVAHVQLDHLGDVEAALAANFKPFTTAEEDFAAETTSQEPDPADELPKTSAFDDFASLEDPIPDSPPASRPVTGEPVLVELNGLMGAMQDYLYENSFFPCRNAAGLAALVVMSAIANARHATPTGLKLSLYGLVVMPTSTGKDSLKSGAREIMEALGAQRSLGAMGSSWQAMHNILEKKELRETSLRAGLVAARKADIDSDDPEVRQNAWNDVNAQAEEMMQQGQGYPATTLSIVDEFQKHFAGIDSGRNSYQQELRDYLLEVYTEQGTLRPSEAMSRSSLPLKRPGFSLLGFSTPDVMYEILGSQVSNGLVGRLLVYANTVRPEKNYDRLTTAPSLGEVGTWLQDAKNLHRGVRDVPWGEGALEHYIALDRDQIEPMKIGEVAPLAGRLGEKMLKVATLIALSDCAHFPEVTVERLDQAWGIVMGLHEQFLSAVDAHGGLGAKSFRKLEVAVEQSMRRWCQSNTDTIPHSKLKERCKPFRDADNRAQADAINQLTRSGLVRVVKDGKGVKYKWLGETK